jgi:hypothetical protein
LLLPCTAVIQKLIATTVYPFHSGHNHHKLLTEPMIFLTAGCDGRYIDVNKPSRWRAGARSQLTLGLPVNVIGERRERSDMAVFIFIALTVAVFGLLGVIQRLVERL